MNADMPPRARLLNDAPAAEDAFGSHERLASALATILTDEPGGKAVALEGGWGSGKSTVVNLLKNALSKNSSHSLLVFDAWAHEGDPLRRTFLENLIEHLTTEGWVSDKKEWKKKREELAHRRKVTTEATVPNLTTFGKLLALTTFLVPLGFALLNSALRDGARFLPFQSSEPAWKLIIGLLMTGAPVLLFVGNLLALQGRRRFGSRKGPTGEEVALSWGLLINGKVEEKRTETIETPNPTSVEFETIFTALLDETLRKHERRLVLVLDNLDRVSSSDALSIWGTLGTFLDLTRRVSPAWRDQLWVLVPYDPGSIRRLWNEGAKDQKLEDAHATQDARAAQGRGPSFLDKAFQLRLVVPPLVLSNWHEYLLALLAEALPEEEKSHFHSVYRVFALHAADGTPPTPRDLKLYVNGISGIYCQWGSAVPLPDAAYYVLLTRDGFSSAEIAKKLRTGQLPAPNLRTVLTKSIRDNLAVLLFNVETSRARQLLLEEELGNVLQKPDPETLIELADAPGFWEVLETLDFHQLAKKEGDKIANVARSLHESGVVKQISSPMCQTTIRNLRGAAEAVESWAPFGENIGKGLVALCSLVPETAFAEHLVTVLTAVEGRVRSDAEENTALQWFATTLLLIRGLSRLNLDEALHDGIRIPGGSATALAVLAALYTKDPERDSWASYRVQADGAEIVTTLTAATTEDTLSESHVNALQVLLVLKAVEDWGPLLKSVKAHLGAPGTLSDMQIHILLRILWALKSSDDRADAVLSEIATTGHLMHHLHTLAGQQFSEEAIQARAWCVFLQFLYAPESTTAPAVGNSALGIRYLENLVGSPQSDEGAVAHLSNLFSQHGGVEHLLDLVRKDPSAKPLLLACIAAAKEGSHLTALLPVPILLENWRVMRDEECFLDVVDAVIQGTDIQDQIMSADFQPAHSGLYAALVRTNHSTGEFKDWCVLGLKAIQLEVWRREFRDGPNAADLIVALVDAEVDFELEQEYQDTIAEHGKAVIGGNVIPAYSHEHGRKLLIPLKGTQRKMVQRRLYEAAVQAAGKIDPTFFDLYGIELLDAETLLLDDKAVAGLFTPLLTQKNVRGLQWLQGFLTKTPDFLQKHPAKETVVDFRERVARMRAKVPEEEEALQHAITALAAQLGAASRDVEEAKSDEKKENK